MIRKTLALTMMLALGACGEKKEEAASEGAAPAATSEAASAATSEAAPAVTSEAAATAPAGKKIVISNWDGYMPKDLLENFTKETGIQAEMTVHATNEEIMGKVVASGGKGYDVLFVSGQFGEALHKLGLAAELDHAKIPNLANLYPEAMKLSHDEGLHYSVPYAWGTTGLCYRSDIIKEAPTSWNDLLKPADAIKGKTTMLATDRWLMMPALLAAGYSVNTVKEDEIAAAKAQLIETKKTLLAYDDTTFYTKLVNGEAVMVEAWDGWCNYGITEKPEIKYVVPKEGSDMWVDTMVVTSASENKEAAEAFINYVLKPDVHRWVAENILYKVPNKAAMDALDPKLIAQYPNLGITPAELLKYEQLRDLGDGQKLWSKTVTEITSSN
ncbi:polyamine ABC transporter substrate-binding protein [Dongia rigui]|uniref:Putrescine-binding periplasmic protein n=1 Tax=Dongia rigui TaxID=940149 RepID=A0ABU5DWZ1_9PROT|nr:spermidine/putrescine ABC transporter substrate-binding protein [Dongia rigui]MDY0871738.1 spermidine/putrescine ABC transporter substrate-binding protein [Dongia rigui]